LVIGNFKSGIFYFVDLYHKETIPI